MIRGRKGQISNLYHYVLIFVLCGLLIGVGITLLDKFGDKVMTDTSVTNEGGLANGSVSLANTHIRSVSSVTITNGTSVSTFSLSGDTLTIVYPNASAVFNASYTYGANSTASKGVFNSLNSILPVASDWMPIIVIVAVLGIVLALVLGAFGNYKNRK